jgi:DNA polymerase III delta prime subunit
MGTAIGRNLDPQRRSYESRDFETGLRRKVVGQDEAVQAVVDLYQVFRAGLNSPGRPVGNLLFLGPTGAGKTRVVEAAAEVLFGEAAARMKKSVRPYDTVGRYGGEEFLIVVPASDAVGTLGLSERIRKSIESVPVATNSGDVHITASLGVAVSSTTRRFDPETLLRLADDALYRAKEHGRNRSELAVTPPDDDAVPTAPDSAVLPTGSR